MARQSLPDAEVPDPGRITSQQGFGRELTLARQQARLTIRDVARASGIPVSTVGDYFAARHLPPARQPELLPSILAACQITEPEQVARWLDALNRVRRAPGRPPAGPAPHRGLASFQPEDAAWFFGRGELALHPWPWDCADRPGVPSGQAAGPYRLRGPPPMPGHHIHKMPPGPWVLSPAPVRCARSARARGRRWCPCPCSVPGRGRRRLPGTPS